MLFDNSGLNAPPRLVLQFAAGRLARAEALLPSWVLSGYAADLVF
ncbi:hypothetical protein PUH89_08975 [Rhodobacter capsulatus]|nr:hypothetical protein [Rhodobacter capsulatus]WER11082.1 hypothetical protein PUH89_08975 [Rhodobacter capsulatus]